MNHELDKCVDTLYELGVKLRKRKNIVEKILDDRR